MEENKEGVEPKKDHHHGGHHHSHHDHKNEGAGCCGMSCGSGHCQGGHKLLRLLFLILAVAIIFIIGLSFGSRIGSYHRINNCDMRGDFNNKGEGCGMMRGQNNTRVGEGFRAIPVENIINSSTPAAPVSPVAPLQ